MTPKPSETTCAEPFSPPTRTSMTEPSSPRSRRRLRRVQSILDAAMAIVVEKGLEKLTIQTLARRLDYTPGALYRYFSSKDELLASLERRVIEGYADVLPRGWSRLSASLAEREVSADALALAPLLLTTMIYRQLSELQPARFHLLSALVGTPRVLVSDDDVARSGAGPTLALVAQVIQHFEHAATTDALDDGAGLERVLILWSSHHGILERRKLNRLLPIPLDINRLASQTTHALLRGWGAKPDALLEAAREVDRLNSPTLLTATLLDAAAAE